MSSVIDAIIELFSIERKEELVPSGVEFEEGGTKKKGDNTVRICYSIADNTRKQIGRNCHHEYSIPQEFRERQGSNWVN